MRNKKLKKEVFQKWVNEFLVSKFYWYQHVIDWRFKKSKASWHQERPGHWSLQHPCCHSRCFWPWAAPKTPPGVSDPQLKFVFSKKLLDEPCNASDFKTFLIPSSSLFIKSYGMNPAMLQIYKPQPILRIALKRSKQQKPFKWPKPSKKSSSLKDIIDRKFKKTSCLSWVVLCHVSIPNQNSWNIIKTR